MEMSQQTYRVSQVPCDTGLRLATIITNSTWDEKPKTIRMKIVLTLYLIKTHVKSIDEGSSKSGFKKLLFVKVKVVVFD